MQRLILTMLLSVATFSIAAAQVVRGKVTDEAGEALPRAHISIAGGTGGTITNLQGDFELLLPAPEAELEIRYVGYKTFTRTVYDGEVLAIRMEQNSVGLQMVVIRDLNPDELLQRAIDRIPENHKGTPFTVDGFYRLVARSQENPDTLLHISEAAYQWYRPGSSKNKDQLRLFRTRQERDITVFNGNTEVFFAMRPKSLMQMDPTRLSAGGILSKKGLRQHDFKLIGQVDFQGEPSYQYEFDQVDGLKKSRYRGRFWIHTESLAFLGFDISRSPKGMPFWKVEDLGQRTLMKLVDIHQVLQTDSVAIRYRKVGSRWMLEDVAAKAGMRLYSGRNDFDFRTVAYVDFSLSRMDTTAVEPFPADEVLAKNAWIEQVDSPDDPDFWKDYQIVLPDLSYEKEAVLIRRRNEVWMKASEAEGTEEIEE